MILDKNSLISPVETAKCLGVKTNTLAVWRSTNRYQLPFVKIGGRVMYRLIDVHRFIEASVINDNELTERGSSNE